MDIYILILNTEFLHILAIRRDGVPRIKKYFSSDLANLYSYFLVSMDHISAKSVFIMNIRQ